MLAAKIAISTAIFISSTLSLTTNESHNYLSETNKQEALQLVNQLRAKGCQCGNRYMPPVGPVTWNALLENAALSHASDMKRNRFFAHKGSNGSNIGDRAKRAGYQWVAVGENIAEGYGSFSATLLAWKKSPGHCRNLMQAGFSEMGVSKIGDLWVQEFGASTSKYAMKKPAGLEK